METIDFNRVKGQLLDWAARVPGVNCSQPGTRAYDLEHLAFLKSVLKGFHWTPTVLEGYSLEGVQLDVRDLRKKLFPNIIGRWVDQLGELYRLRRDRIIAPYKVIDAKQALRTLPHRIDKGQPWLPSEFALAVIQEAAINRSLQHLLLGHHAQDDIKGHFFHDEHKSPFLFLHDLEISGQKIRYQIHAGYNEMTRLYEVVRYQASMFRIEKWPKGNINGVDVDALHKRMGAINWMNPGVLERKVDLPFGLIDELAHIGIISQLQQLKNGFNPMGIKAYEGLVLSHLAYTPHEEMIDGLEGLKRRHEVKMAVDVKHGPALDAFQVSQLFQGRTAIKAEAAADGHAYWINRYGVQPRQEDGYIKLHRMERWLVDRQSLDLNQVKPGANQVNTKQERKVSLSRARERFHQRWPIQKKEPSNYRLRSNKR
jgi:hypothetical protein